MAIIGTFTQNGNGLQGTVKTLTLNAKVRFVPVEKDNDKSPDFLGHRRHHERRARCRLDLERAGPTPRSSSTIRASRPRSTPP